MPTTTGYSFKTWPTRSHTPFTPDADPSAMDPPDYADAPDYGDLSEKDVLLYILAELQTIRYALTPPETHETAAYRCRTCDTVVPPDERQTHLTEQHNAFDGIDVTEEFERVVAEG